LTGGELLFKNEDLGLPIEALVSRYDVLEGGVSDGQSLVEFFNLILKFLMLLLVDDNRLLIGGTLQCRISFNLCEALVVLAFLSYLNSASSSLSCQCISCSLLLDSLKVEAAHVTSTGVVGVNKTF